MKMKILAAAVVLALAGCASAPQGSTDMGYTPVVDMAGVSPAKYSADLDQCTEYAHERPGASSAGAAGAIAGALLGGLIGAAFGNGSDAAWLAGFGALGGASGTAQQAEGTQRQIIARCLAGRGYKVLD